MLLVMSLCVIPLGGSLEIGRNSIALEIDGKILILDMGFHLERFIQVTEHDFPHQKVPVRKLASAKALPDIRVLRKKRRQVVGILCSHAHLDHIGALPFLANKFDCPIYATPFTGAVVRSLCEEKKTRVDLHVFNPGSSFRIGELLVEFIPVAHSTPQTVIVAIHTPYGVVVYANDYKDDAHPPFGQATDVKRLHQLQGKVKLLLVDSLYAPADDFCPSESVARLELLDLASQLKDKRLVVASAFSSHIYRLETLCDLAQRLGREVVFLGRSLGKYIDAAAQANIIDLSKRGRVLRYPGQIRSFMSNLPAPEEYFLIATGHQGEPKAVLSRLVNGLYEFSCADALIFSCMTIPTPTNREHRRILEQVYANKRVHMYRDVHVSGHAFARDHRRLVDVLKPEYVVPLHGEQAMTNAMRRHLLNWGYEDKNIIILAVGEQKDVA